MSEEKQKRIEEIEHLMGQNDFWSDKNKAQMMIRELQDLKLSLEGGSAYDRGDAVITIYAGAGGDDSEDFAAMLANMYQKFSNRSNFSINLLHEHKNEKGGYRNITFEIKGKNVYGTLKNESGVHRLVRISPFNAKSLRHTSFAMVEVIPKFDKAMNIEIPEVDFKVEFTRGGGPGGQNVNKRETAVRVIHLPSKLSVVIATERSQGQNREKAMELIKGKLYAIMEKERIAKEKGMQISVTTEAEWGSQIRSYVLHPYKMVKDHRTNIETSNVEAVLEEGELDEFIEAEKGL